jgi:EAL domain-containing protein (putative c-di-GMP-specific phosphodiesterase class I)
MRSAGLINVSPVQVRDRAFVELVSAVLQETGFDASRLVLEMTENVLIENANETMERGCRSCVHWTSALRSTISAPAIRA